MAYARACVAGVTCTGAAASSDDPFDLDFGIATLADGTFDEHITDTLWDPNAKSDLLMQTFAYLESGHQQVYSRTVV